MRSGCKCRKANTLPCWNATKCSRCVYVIFLALQSRMVCTWAFALVSRSVPLNSIDLLESNSEVEVRRRGNCFDPAITRQRPCRARRSFSQLFGIRGFREKFGSAFPSAVTEISYRKEPCDHLLIDVNQFLHMVLRKAGGRSGDCWDRSLLFLMRELDNIVKFAAPRKSLVLAMDGPPPAAKLGTQRKRRQTTLDRTEAQIELFERLSKNKSRKRNPKRLQKVWNRKKKHWTVVMATLAITPGTEYMDRAASAILYWVWQRLQLRHGPLHKLQIFLSSSEVPGEGEVKLMEWLYRPENQICPHDYVVMIGGDSDLVLQGLMVPPVLTRNVDVLMPNQGTYIAFRISEIVESLRREYMPHLSEQNMMKVRADVVLCFILNGNDYLPKLRGSSGFSSLFNIYTKLSRTWHANGKARDAYLVDPDTLEFNREFGMEFFARLKESQKFISPFVAGKSYGDDRKALGQLNTLKDIGIIPPNVRFEVIAHGNDCTCELCYLNESALAPVRELVVAQEESHSSNLTNAFSPSAKSNVEDTGETQSEFWPVTVQLHVGTPDSDEYEVYELNRTLTRPKSDSLRQVHRELAALAIKDLLSIDSETFDVDDDEDVEDDDNDDNDSSFNGNPGSGVHASVEKYVYGLLWNLQMYRDGTVSDFGFNYGKRLAPVPDDIYDFLKLQKPIELFETPHASPISAALSCVAALPLKVKDLIPKPYSLLSDEAIEHMYTSCVDKNDSSFDIRKFAELSIFYVPWKEKIEETETGLVKPCKNGWTVLRKDASESPQSWNPPEPFSPWLAQLHHDNFIHVIELASLENTQSSRISSRIGFWTVGVNGVSDNDRMKSELTHMSPENVDVPDKDHNETSLSAMVSDVQSETSKLKLSTSDGLTALQFLNMLVDLGLVAHWESVVDDAQTHSITLTVQSEWHPALKNQDIVVERQRRFPYRKSAKHLKHEIAAVVLEHMFSRAWFQCSSRELKAQYMHANEIDRLKVVNGRTSSSINTTADGTDAISCLKQLDDAGLITVKWATSEGSEIKSEP
ncbi:hypothetical protein ACA910_022204 [Epithemia clementina (nom. ined.)]